MTTQRQGTGNRLAGPKNRSALRKYPARLFPIQHEIQKLREELNAFNERIADLENEGHRGHGDGSVEGKSDGFCSPDR
jgi:hypothetical protein